MKLREHEIGFVERVGRWWESLSGSRTAGRILGWLMICEPPHQSSADLVEALSISAGSVSTLIRQLEMIDLVERVTFPGDRSTYFQLPKNVWSKMMWGEQARIREMARLGDDAADVMPSHRTDRITELAVIAEFFEEEWPGLMERLARRLEKEGR
jgi:DNA-binding transcriptional regulator GbsR (MarR family)